MAKKTFEDLIQVEIDTIDSEIADIKKEQDKLSKKIRALEIQEDRLWKKAMRLAGSLEKAKKDSAKLKRMAWKSENVNVADLRDELLLLAAKKLRDAEQVVEEGG